MSTARRVTRRRSRCVPSRRCRLLAVAACAAVTAGCAGIPQSGQIHVGHVPPAANGAGFDGVQVLPPNPQNGATPAELVAGFLSAMGDSAGGYSVAREFLAPGTKWTLGDTVTTYAAPPLVRRTGPRSVVMVANRVGLISPRGLYHVAPGVIHRRFTVTRSGGQWRISALQDGVLLSTDEAVRSLQPVAVYFLNRTQDRLVPEPILISPQQPGLATTLVNDLLAGPSPALAPGVTTAVPQGTTLTGTVPVDNNGVAEVNLSSQARDLAPAQLVRLSAQLAWTLRQLSSVSRIRLLANNTPLTSRAVPAVQSVEAWRQFDPDAPPSSTGALYTEGGATGGIGMAVPKALARQSVSFPARSADGTTVAALRAGALVIGPADGSLRPRLTGSRLSPPAFDPAGDVFVATAAGPGTRLVEVPVSGPPRDVGLPRYLSRQRIDALAISRDGSRVALVVGPPRHAALQVGTLSSQPSQPVVRDVSTIISPGHAVAGVAWLGANQIVTTERSGPGHRTVVEISCDGYQTTDLATAGAPPAPAEVAAAPGQRVLIAADGGIWALSGNGWVRRVAGDQPSYAG